MIVIPHPNVFTINRADVRCKTAVAPQRARTMAESMPVPDTCGPRHRACPLRRKRCRNPGPKKMCGAAEERLNLSTRPALGLRRGCCRHHDSSSSRLRDLVFSHWVQESSLRAAEGLREYQLKVLSATQANVNALFEYAHDLLQAQSMSELVDVSTTHSRHQLEMMAEQTRELADSAQKIATETTRPLASAFGSQGAQMS